MANYPTEYGTTPVGRIIMHPREGLFQKGTTDQHNRPIEPNKQRYFVGLAVEKSAPGVNEMLGILQKAAMAGYASNPQVMQQIQMGLGATAFSWKVQDGDEMIVNPETGQQELRTPHGQGCWIFKFSTTIPMRAAKFPPGANVPVDCGEDELYKGCFAQISYSASANGNIDHTAGVYLNPKTICLIGYGEPITGGPSLEQQFQGGTGGYVPAGMSQTPLAPTGAPVGMGQQQPPMGQQQPPMGQQQPPMGQQQPDPMNSGAQMPAPSGQPGETGSPGNQPPGQYGGYMNPQG